MKNVYLQNIFLYIQLRIEVFSYLNQLLFTLRNNGKNVINYKINDTEILT